jgi:hypothetical protein
MWSAKLSNLSDITVDYELLARGVPLECTSVLIRRKLLLELLRTQHLEAKPILPVSDDLAQCKEILNSIGKLTESSRDADSGYLLDELDFLKTRVSRIQATKVEQKLETRELMNNVEKLRLDLGMKTRVRIDLSAATKEELEEIEQWRDAYFGQQGSENLANIALSSNVQIVPGSQPTAMTPELIEPVTPSPPLPLDHTNDFVQHTSVSAITSSERAQSESDNDEFTGEALQHSVRRQIATATLRVQNSIPKQPFAHNYNGNNNNNNRIDFDHDDGLSDDDENNMFVENPENSAIGMETDVSHVNKSFPNWRYRRKVSLTVPLEVQPYNRSRLNSTHGRVCNRKSPRVKIWQRQWHRQRTWKQSNGRPRRIQVQRCKVINISTTNELAIKIKNERHQDNSSAVRQHIDLGIGVLFALMRQRILSVNRVLVV